MDGRATDRYDMLDGLRGLAAIAVVILHHRQVFGGDAVFGHAYLAVDFFFILSGFVLSRTYSARLTHPGAVSAFLIDRVIRLGPLLLLGVGLGTMARIWMGATVQDAAMTGLVNSIALPALGPGEPFISDPPAWSLFWELVANAAFAVAVANRIGAWKPAILCGLAMLIINYLETGFDVGWDRSTLLLGAPRIGLGFALGVILARTAPPPEAASAARPWLAPALLAVFTLLPNRSAVSMVYDPLVTIVLFPILVGLAARSRPLFPRFARMSGELSFPLYILHDPLIRWLTIGVQSLGLTVTHGTERLFFPITILLSLAALTFFDRPLRQALRAYRRKHRKLVEMHHLAVADI